MSKPAGLSRSLTLCALALGSGCAMLSRHSAPKATAPDITRTELVLLNVNEASGWVAYACEEKDSSNVEEYRIVVLRARSGEIIYDSTVPLPSNLCTHGFEMDSRDPRLIRMARSVDRDLIKPLEASQAGVEPVPTVIQPAVPSAPPPPSPPTATATGTPILLSTKGNQVRIRLPESGKVSVGQRYFVRGPDRVIQLPGMEETLVNPGEIVGMIEVRALEGQEAEAVLVSGQIPEGAVLTSPTRD